MRRILQTISIMLLIAGGALLAVYTSDAGTQAKLVHWWQAGRAAEQAGEEQVADSLRSAGERLQAALPQVADRAAEAIAPVPLRSEDPATAGVLTAAGVIAETNRQRAQEQLVPLRSNAALASAAMAKVEDMFAQQYFEHVAPDGTDVADLIKATGYAYIVVGENLALGGYENDADLVQAWMDSPGHRANIMHDRFTEIGVAAKKGMFEGREVWLAVQEFGKPRSDCPAPDETLNASIEANNKQLDAWQTALAVQKAEVEETSTASPSYNREVREYNALVERYNGLLEETKGIVSEYNAQVQAFNACAAG